MQRLIKFRAWDSILESFSKNDWMFYSYRASGNCQISTGFGGVRYFISQYTGLMDKNGQDIYEGDVVRCGFSNGDYGTGEVKFIDGCFEVNFPNFTISDGYNREYLKVFVANHAVEVIGNLYESPSLLDNNS